MKIARRALPTGAGVALAIASLATPALAGEEAPIDAALEAHIEEALQDEYHGRALYGHVLEELGDVRPFSNVIQAEERHAALLEGLLESRDLPVPGDRWSDAEVPTFASRRDACAAAVAFEVANGALYDSVLAEADLPEDVKRVFEHNRMASLERHKPAFERCATGGGGQGRGGPSASRGSGCGHGRCARARSASGPRGCGRAGHGCGGGCGGNRDASAPTPGESGS